MTGDSSISPRLRRKVELDFVADSVDTVVTRLESLDLVMAEKQSLERIQAAIAILADGNVEMLEWAARRAESDWRDVLVWSGLGQPDWPARLDDALDPGGQ